MGAEVVLCVSEVGWFFFFLMLVAFIHHPKLESDFFSRQPWFLPVHLKDVAYFLKYSAPKFWIAFFSIYRVLSSLGDSSVPLNCPKWKQSPFGNPSAYSSHGWMFFSGSSCASWGHCFSHSCMSPLPAPGYTSPLDMPARMVVCLLPGLLQANEFHLN